MKRRRFYGSLWTRRRDADQVRWKLFLIAAKQVESHNNTNTSIRRTRRGPVKALYYFVLTFPFKTLIRCSTCARNVDVLTRLHS